MSRVSPTERGNKEGDDDEASTKAAWLASGSRALLDYTVQTWKGDYMKFKAKQRPKCKRCRFIF